MRTAFESNRRAFLKSATAALCVGPSLFARALAARGDTSDDRVLVLLELAGGNDALNMLVPFADDAYYRVRPNIAIAANELVKLDDEVGLHPALAKLKPLYDAGNFALIEGAGYPDPIRSHFLSMDVWESGDLEGRNAGTGWVGRLADSAYADLDDPNVVVALGQKVPFSCEGERYRAVALSSVKAYRVVGEDRMVESLDSAISSQKVSEHARKFLRDAYVKARESSEAVAAAAAQYKPGAEYPNNSPLAGDLRTVVSLIAGGLKTRVFAVQMGGFDTHNNQVQRHNQLYTNLAGSLAAFFDDLKAHALSDRVMVLGFSEFGRRVKSNASGGTDHGTAGTMFALGASVKGGRHGKRPSLTELDANGDFVHTTDFRSAYATVIERYLRCDARKVIPKAPGRLGFLS